MVRKLYLAFFAIIFCLYSCSTDKENENGTEENPIVGIWDAAELKIDEGTASDGAKNGRDILGFLTARDCYILSLTFNEDLSLVIENAGNYLEININNEGTGIDVPCPTQRDTETTSYTFANGLLSVMDGNGETVTVNVAITGDLMTVNAADLDIPNFNDEGELIFRRR